MTPFWRRREDSVVAEADARHGRMAYLKNDVWHGRAFSLYGEWSEAEVALWRDLVFPGDTVVDAGAHIGAHTVALARLVGPKGRVHAYEPQRVPFQLLCANVVANRLWNVETHEAALGRDVRQMWYDEPDYARADNFGGLELKSYMRSRKAAVVPLDWQGIGEVELIKADVEGMEREVVLGAADTIQRDQPVLYLEADRAGQRAALFGTLRAMGYRLWWHRAPLYNPDNFRRRHENVFGDTVSLSVLAMPPRAEPPYWHGLEEAE